MAHVIVVAPIEGGWCVQRDMSEPWTFEGRPQAEWSARRLGEALAEGGEAAELRVLLAGGVQATRFVFVPADAADVTAVCEAGRGAGIAASSEAG